MKAVVLETRDGWAAVLRDDGVVEKIRRRCEVGDTIELEDRSVIPFPKRVGRMATAAAAALILLTGGGLYGYNNAYAYSYVTLDANPSIEYVLNRRNEVLRVAALNEDAEPIVATLNESGVRKESLSDAIDETIALLYESDYLTEDGDNCILISVSSRGSEQAQYLLDEVGAYYDEHENELTVYVAEATAEDTRQAQKLGVSTGRFKLAEELDGEPDADRIENATVRELIDARDGVSGPNTETPAVTQGPAEERTPASSPRQTESEASGELPAQGSETELSRDSTPQQDDTSAPQSEAEARQGAASEESDTARGTTTGEPGR